VLLPLNHFAGKVALSEFFLMPWHSLRMLMSGKGTQGQLLGARDERVGLMNEVLGAIRMIKVPSFSCCRGKTGS
jgi:hypothetical protein